MKKVPCKTPKLLKSLFPKYTWDITNTETTPRIYLTFDDGPIPEVTEFVLDELSKHQAKATFFCIGDNIKKHPNIFKDILHQGHSIGNHTFNHPHAWKTPFKEYIDNFVLCEKQILTHAKLTRKLFRPPYGQVSKSKLNHILQKGYQIILWDVLAKDWLSCIEPKKCAQNVIKNAKNGSIVVFHDSIKAYKNIKVALPMVLEHFSKRGFIFDKI